MEVANTLAYYNTATIIAVKTFIVQAPGGRNLQLISPHRNNPICVASHKEAKTCRGSIIEHCILDTNAGKQQS
jgi:hypothetical protein